MKRLFICLFTAALAVTVVAQNPPAGQTAAPAQQQRPPLPPLGPNEWRIDSAHSAANFSVRHMMVTTVRGQLGPISGTIEYDGNDVRSVRADVLVDVKAINTQNQRRDDHLRSDDFFDVPNHPVIAFKSKRVEPGSGGQFKLIGDLTIRGNTNEVALDIENPAALVKDQRGGVRTGTTATTRLKRLEYGLKWNNMIEAGPVVSDDVTVTLDIQATRPIPPGSGT